MIKNKPIGIVSRKTSYDIWIGKNLVKKKHNDLKSTLALKKIAIITDKNVHSYQYSNLLAQLSDLEINPHLFLIEPGESSKSWDVLKKVLDWLTELNFDRTDYIIAFGGGVVGDLASLAASLFRRGVNLIQVPTTFLSQVLLNLMTYTNVLVASMEMRPVIQIAKMIQQTGIREANDQHIEEFCEKYKNKLWLFNAQVTTSEDDLVASLHFVKNVHDCDVVFS